MKYPIPTEPGFYWAKSETPMGKTRLVLIRVSGESPFLCANDVWNTFEKGSLPLVGLEWGPRIDFPFDFSHEHQILIPPDIFSSENV